MPGTAASDRAIRVRVVLLVLAIAAGVGFAIGFTPPAEVDDPINEVVVRLCLVVAVVLATVLLASGLSITAKGLLVAVIASGFLVAASAIILNANPFAPLGTALDQSFRSAYLTKLAAHWDLRDFAYADLPSYYPPLWFWLLGRVASITGQPGWHMLRTGLIMTAAITPLFSWLMWRRVVAPAVAIGATLGVLAFQEWYATYEWLAAVLFVPWWLFFVLGIGEEEASGASSWGRRVAGAAIGAALFCTYYYFFFIGAVQLVVLAVLRRRAGTRTLVPDRWSPRESAIVLGGTAALSSPYWLPLLFSVLDRGLEPLQAEFYGSGFATLRFPFLSFDLVGITLLVGLGYLVFSAARSSVSRALLVLLGSAYLWYVVEYVLVLTGTSLTGFKSDLLVRSILAVAAGMAAVQMIIAVAGPGARRRLRAFAPPLPACAVALFVLALALGQQAVAIPYVKDQRQATRPVQLLRDFDDATSGRANGAVLLTDVVDLPIFRDVFVFNVWRAHYAHPGAEFSERTGFLARLSHERDPEVFALALAHNRFDQIDYVVLRLRADGTLPYTFSDDDFPRGTKERTFSYDLSLFGTPTFERTDTVSFVVFRLRRDADPLRDLRSCRRTPQDARCDVLVDAIRRYKPFLDDAVLEVGAARRDALSARGG